MYDIAKTKPIPADLGARRRYHGELVPIARLMDAVIEAGGDLKGYSFVDCIVRGPAVLIPGPTTELIDCNLGEVSGDVRNLFLQAAGPLIIGAIPVEGCRFEGCLFIGLGLAGNSEFIASMSASLKQSGGAAQ